jgi:CHAD domain-containing protein
MAPGIPVEGIMWLFTTVGFFSIVQKTNEPLLTVRARVADDLGQLRDLEVLRLAFELHRGATREWVMINEYE